jgi:hypothetical protein
VGEVCMCDMAERLEVSVAYKDLDGPRFIPRDPETSSWNKRVDPKV